MEPVEQFSSMFAGAQRIVVLTGAGLSAGSGIATFRGVDGIWKGFWGNLRMLYFGTPVGWKLTPGLAWRAFASEFFAPIRAAEPNAGHLAIAQLEEKALAENKSFCVVTQNVDNLHQRAGSKIVYEPHGSVFRYRCQSFRSHPIPISPADVDPNHPPVCPQCQSRGRPDVVLFMESLSSDFFEAYNEVSHMKPGDLMIVVGTSATVYPVAELPALALRRGAKLIELNREATPLTDAASYVLQGLAEETLPTLVNEVRGGDSS
eukprot:Rmarinus@m.8091